LYSQSSCKVLLKDDQTLILVDKELAVYNISQIQSAPVHRGSLRIFVEEVKVVPQIISIKLSPDKNKLYAQVYDDFLRLQIYNISAVTAPHLVFEYTFYRLDTRMEYSEDLITFAPDFKTGFTARGGEGILKFKLPERKDEEIKISAQIPYYGKFNGASKWIISPDGQTIYTNTLERSTIQVLSTRPEYTVYLKQEKFLLGKRSSDKVEILTQANSFESGPMNQSSFKIIKLTLYDMKFVPSGFDPEFTESALPSWIKFDNRRNLLTLEPQKQNDVGIYTLKSAISLKIPDNAFDNLDVSSEDLLAWLISLDYIDNQLFLTESFASIESVYSSSSSLGLKTFYLPAQFKLYKQQIYDILTTFSIKTCTGIAVVPSLEFKRDDHSFVEILSPSLENIKVEINLDIAGDDGKSQALFVQKSYPQLLSFIADKKTRLYLEGSLKNINTALQSIIVDFADSDITFYDANFTIQDGLNKPLTIPLKNISKLFIPNRPPALKNRTIQQQINMTDIYTGQRFTVDFEHDTFIDNFTDTLTYELMMANNNTAEVPKWLSLNGVRLQGNPPEEVLQDIELILVAKNEFKQLKEPFTLRVRISLLFSLKLMLKYGSYVVSLFGLLIILNKILNVLGGKFYKHPKEYVLNPGEKITPEIIAPIFFVHKEKQESNLILRFLEKYTGKKLESKSVFLDYFMDSSGKVLEKQKVLNTIQTVVSRLPLKDKENLSHYCSSQNSRKWLIEQLIYDQLTLWQLDGDKETKSIFKKIKDKWTEVLDWDPSLSRFALNQNKFEQLVEENCSLFTQPELCDDSLLLSPGFNMALLRDSILAYAFRFHQISKEPARVEVIMKEQLKSNFVKRLLKRDLESIRQINYGIKYKITNDILNFSGIPKNNLAGKNLVIHISTARNRILKEIWICGARESLMNQEIGLDNLPKENSDEIY